MKGLAKSIGTYESSQKEAIREHLRGPKLLPPGVVYYGDPPRAVTPEWVVYALLEQLGADNSEFVDHINTRVVGLRWWLTQYARDDEQPAHLREYAQSAMAGVAFQGKPRPTGAVPPRPAVTVSEGVDPFRPETEPGSPGKGEKRMCT